MEGKKVSTFLKSRKSTGGSSMNLTGSNNSQTLPTSMSSSTSSSSSSSPNSSILSQSIASSNGSSGNISVTNSTNDLAQFNETYQKRNTRQIPSILLEDEIEKEEDYPFDFERYYYESKEINREVSRELVVIPDDATQNQIENLPKENRIKSNPFDYKENKNQHIDDCIKFYSNNTWKSLKTFNYYKNETPGAIIQQLTEERIEFKTEPIVNINNLNSNVNISISQAQKIASEAALEAKLAPQQQTPQQQQMAALQFQQQQNLKEVNYLSQQHQYQIQNTLKTDKPDKLHLHYLERQFRKEKVLINNNSSNSNNNNNNNNNNNGENNGENNENNTELGLYSYFTLSEPTVQYQEPTPYQNEKKRIVQVTFKDLSFKFWDGDDEPEPFYCSMYLYDIHKKVRLSETFYFDFINDKSFKMTTSHITTSSGASSKDIVVDDVTLAKSAIFNVTARSSSELENIYLILKVEKVLTGDLEDHSEPYIKMNLKEKEKDKFKESIKSSCTRLGAFRQAFCWGCVPVFEEGVGEDTPIRPLYRHRSEMTDSSMLDSTLSEGSKSASVKKLKIIPGQCLVDIKEILPNDQQSPYLNNKKYILNSSLVKVDLPQLEQPQQTTQTTTTTTTTTEQTTNPIQQPGKIPLNIGIENIIKECHEFSSNQRFEINTEFVNNLYLYPETLNLSNRSGSFAARNLTCKIQLLETDENPLCPEGLKAIYGKSKTQSFNSKAYTQVTYHSKSPVFNDEIKIRLPLSPSPSLHILFTFYHIACQKSSGGGDLVDQPVAYGVLPIIQYGKMIGDEVFNLPLAYEFPSRYTRRDQEATIKYIDNKKQIFQVRSKLVSSIHSTDDYLNSFFNNISQFAFINNCLASPGLSPTPTNSLTPSITSPSILTSPTISPQSSTSTSNLAISAAATTMATTTTTASTSASNLSPSNSTMEQLIKSIKLLPSSKLECIIQFFPILMNQLFRLMTNQQHSSELSMVTFITIGEILSMVNDVSGTISDRYVKYVFSNVTNLPGSNIEFLPTYEVLIKTWLELVRFQEQNSENILRFSRFFFQVIHKSMALSLIERNKREENKTRKGRFVGVRPQLAKLISILRWESSTRAKHTFKLAKELIRSLAGFISSLISIADRGYVFKTIDRAVNDFTHNNNQGGGENEMEIYELKFEFLRIICQNDYFVQLNIPLPFRIDSTLKLNNILSCSKHFLSDLLLNNISAGIGSKIPLIRMDAANSLRDTLTRLEMDTRWFDQSNKQRIVGVFIPYLTIVVNNWDNIKDDSFIMKRNILVSFVYLLKTIHINLIKIWWREEPKAKYVTLFDILNQCLEIFEFVGKEILMDKVESSTSLRTSTAKSILEDFYSNSRNSPYGSKKLYNRSLREKRVDSRKSVLENNYSSGNIGGSGGSGGSGNNSVSGSPSSSTILINSTSNTNLSSSFMTSSGGSGYSSKSGGSGGSLVESLNGSVSGYSNSNNNNNNGSTYSPSTREISSGGTLRNEKRMKSTLAQNKINVSDYDDRLESHLALEVGSVVLDVVDEFMCEYDRDLKTSHYFDVIEKIFNLLHSMLKKNQPVQLVPKLYATLRQFIYRFPKILFENNNSFCLDLCNAVIRHCNSVNQTTREEASAFTYILFRKNFEQTKKNFVRTKTQVTIGLSTIVKSINDDYFLKKSLDTINSYANAQADKAGTKSFSKQIEELTKRLHTFVIDNIKINNHRDDPEMVADLYHRIADNNKSNADTRICWLQGLADFHRTQENYVEAAQCYLHMSSLVAEYLSLIGKPIPTINGSSNFMAINKNSLEESHTFIEREEDGADDNQSFTLDFFLKLVQEAISLLKESEYYEIANLVYKLLLPVHEEHLNYQELARCHGDLQDIFKRIVECTNTQSRMLGSYYRVGLYGKRFEEMNGKEFIYKEPKITRLVEIKDRLKSLYSKKLSVPEDSIVIIEGSTVDISTIEQDAAKCYLQITSVVPYFTEEELVGRRTPFDRIVHLNRFIFETPFIESGAGRANSIAEQYKRKTILKTSTYFPYTKKRIAVVSKQEIILSPIENSIETIDQRAEAIANEVRSKVPNPKTLQQVLQGTLRLQVNIGPQEVCRVFLASDPTSGAYNYPVDQIKKLKKSLSLFLGSCSEALFINKGLVENQSSQEFQEEMEQGYVQLTDLMESLGVLPPEGSYYPTLNNNSNINGSSNNLGGSGSPIIQLNSSVIGSSSGNNTPTKSHNRNSSNPNRNSTGSGSTISLENEDDSTFNNLLSTSHASRKSFTQRLSSGFKSD